MSTSSFFSLVEKCQALAICSFLFSFPPFFNVKTMALDSGWGAWTKTSRSKISTCDPVGSSSVLGLECDVGLAAPLNSLPGTVGISWKTVWEWLNKQWKQQQEGKQKTAWAWHCFFLTLYWIAKVIKGDSRKIWEELSKQDLSADIVWMFSRM